MEKTKVINILGTVGTILGILMFVALLEVAKNNLHSTHPILIQPLVTTINCTVWTLYGHLKKERFVFWANFPGIIFGLLTVITAFI